LPPSRFFLRLLYKRFDQNTLQNNDVHYLHVHQQYKVVLNKRVLEQPHELRDQDEENGAEGMGPSGRVCLTSFVCLYRKGGRVVLPQRVYGRQTRIDFDHTVRNTNTLDSGAFPNRNVQ
jgi:hypothetical protein